MKYVDEFRDAARCRRLVAEIQATATAKWTIMEVCGGQTHGLLRYGIDQELRDQVELIHGPGCPVCVTDVAALDDAFGLARRDDVLVTSFGDMLRVPGSHESLLQARAAGGHVQLVYSPLDAVELARQQPQRQVVFLAVGFETTAPATALAVRQARALGLNNFSLLVAHVRVLPAMVHMLASPQSRVQAFLAAGHVCTITGYACYQSVARRYQLPVVVTGFEPVDLLAGILDCVRQLELGTARVSNQYGRGVDYHGNRVARESVEQVFEVCDQNWRGLGVVPEGGLRLREEWSEFDARRRFPELRRRPTTADRAADLRCRSGEVLSGSLKPTQCEHFGRECTPDHPLGAPMVSAEGACAAYHRYALPQVPHASR